MRPGSDRLVARLVLSPTIAVAAVFLYGFALWTGWISLTGSTLLPNYDLAGLVLHEHVRLGAGLAMLDHVVQRGGHRHLQLPRLRRRQAYGSGRARDRDDR